MFSPYSPHWPLYLSFISLSTSVHQKNMCSLCSDYQEVIFLFFLINDRGVILENLLKEGEDHIQRKSLNRKTII